MLYGSDSALPRANPYEPDIENGVKINKKAVCVWRPLNDRCATLAANGTYLQINYKLFVFVLLVDFIANRRYIFAGEWFAGNVKRILVQPRKQLEKLPEPYVQMIGHLCDVLAVAIWIGITESSADRIIDEQ